MEVTLESKVHPAKRANAIPTTFISNYRGVSDYRVPGITGRVSWHSLNEESQAFYGKGESRLIGTVINELDPVPEDVLAMFQARQDDLLVSALDGEKFYVRKLTTAKWYPYLGWVRCEAGE